MKSKAMKVLKSALTLVMAMTCLVFGTASEFKVKANESEENFTQYVDPFVGTEVDYGQLFPGSVAPNGLVKLSPDTYPHETNDHAGYDYSKKYIQGFSHTRIEGVGGQGAGGDVLISPTYVDYTTRPGAESRALKYEKQDEEAHPGYYGVELLAKSGTNSNVKDDASIGKIKAEMTSDVRTGYHKYTFPKEGEVSLLVDLNYTYHGTDIRDAILDVVEEAGNKTTISGRFSGKNVSGHGKYTMYFYLETNRETESVKTWNDNKLSKKTSQTGNDLGAILNFNVEANESVEVKVSISPISSEQAKIDMHTEVPEWDFEKTRTDADASWNEVLGKIKVENSKTSDPDGRLKKLFYTHLYHMFTTPVNATSTSNTYRGTDTNIYEASDYTHYDSWTLWDDYRKYPMIGLVMPDEYKDMVRSIADALETGISTWGNNTQPIPTVRNEHAVALLADAVAKGFTDIDNLPVAYEKVKAIANDAINQEAESLGYIKDRVDRTVEYAYDDWAISLIADSLGLEDEATYFLNRSFNYMNLFKEDAVTLENGDNIGLLWPKDGSGNWKHADPERYGDNGLYQGTLWQYTWYDSNDVNGLQNLMGGKENMLKALSRLYGEQDPDNGKAMLHTNTNEIDLHTPYLFNYAGKPSRTQYWVRQIYSKQTWNRYSGTGEFNPPIYDYAYKLDPSGFLETMDDDAGTMASMYVAAAMGIYPMTPGDTSFQIGSPFFEKVTLDVGDGKTFTIEANNVSEDNFYIQSATLNGDSLDRSWIDYAEITRGGVLKFEMGDSPSTWAEDGIPAKSSSDNVSTSQLRDDEVIYSKSMFEESDLNKGTFEDKIEVELTSLNYEGNIGEDLYAQGKIAITNLPEGLSAKAIITTPQKVEISLHGQAKKHGLNDSIGNLTIEIKDSAVNSPLLSVYKKRDNIKVMFQDDALNYSSDFLTESNKDNGSILDTTTITIKGTTEFTGEIGEDFIATEKVKINNVPEGLTPLLKKTSEKTVVLSFNGNAKEHNIDRDISIEFKDQAFTNGKASSIQNSFRTGMSSLVIDFYNNYKAKLENAIKTAESIKEGVYTTSTYNKLLDTIENGKQVLGDENASEKEIQDAYLSITNAMDKLKGSTNALVRIEAEKSDDWSANGLKNESMNIGGTYDGAWIKFESLDFEQQLIDTIDIRYVNNSGRCAPDSRVEVRKDAVDGELLATVELKPNDSGWGNYTIAKEKINDDVKLDGVYDIYFVMHGTTSVDKPYIANIDYMQFKESQSYERFEAEKYSNWSAGNLKIENSTDTNNNSLVNVGGSYDGAWLAFENLAFTHDGLHEIRVRYVNNSNRCGENARLEVRLDSLDNEPIDVIQLPATGTNWNSYEVASVKLTEKIKGDHTIFFTMRADSNNPYVANLDYFEFYEELNKTELQKLYDDSLSILENKELYTEISVKPFVTAMKDALDVLNSDDALQSDVRYSQKALEKTIETLELKIVGELSDLVDELSAIKEDGYTSDSYKVLQEALSVAKAIPEGSPYAQYKEAYDKLLDANAKLTVLDKSELDQIINEMSEVNLDLYFEEGRERFLSCLDAARKVQASVSLTQTEVDEAVSNLQEAFDNLELIPDVTNLAELVKEAEKIDLSQYKEEGQEAFKEALENAKVLLENPTSSKDIEEAIAQLQQAMGQLVLIEDKPGTEVDPNEELPSIDANGDDGSINTGTSVMGTEFILCLLGLSGSSILMLRRKKSKKIR
ncbi:hypothetical protein A4S06_01195 [Erysipelotrichaceae bacterium MTC7]|nr:hypothetical protein A4S06_01195 [Erysipelotrichaceae bacterium MTC7]